MSACAYPQERSTLCPHINIFSGWRNFFGAEASVNDDKSTGAVMFTGDSDRSMTLYVVPVDKLLGD